MSGNKRNSTKAIRRYIDICMTILMLCLMAYQVTGEVFHEWIGIGMTALVVVHQIINRKWYSAIIKGRYTLLRAWILCIDVLLLISFAVNAICGISMSSHAMPYMYGLLPIAFARTRHLALSHWSFIFMGLHIGIHIPSMTAGIKLNTITRTVIYVLFCIMSGLGFFIFIRSGIINYLTFKVHFAFLDYDKASVLVFIENILMLLFWSFIGMQIFNLFRNGKGVRDEA